MLKYPGGKFLVIVIGLALIGGGIYLAYEAWKEKFRRDMELGQMRARTRRIVEWLGKFGGVARGAVFVTAGIFLVVAAVEAKPRQAKGIDSSLRVLASTPPGPWLLVLVTIGLIVMSLPVRRGQLGRELVSLGLGFGQNRLIRTMPASHDPQRTSSLRSAAADGEPQRVPESISDLSSSPSHVRVHRIPYRKRR